MRIQRYSGEEKDLDVTRLKGVLNQSDLNQKDDPLYEVLDSLISNAATISQRLREKLAADGVINPITQLGGKVPVSFGGVVTGNYVPLFTLVANVGAAGVDQFYWSREGDLVRVFGKIQINVTALTVLTRLLITLPILSYFDGVYQCVGVAASDTVNQQGAIRGDIANNQAELAFLSTATGIFDMYLNFSYLIVAQ